MKPNFALTFTSDSIGLLHRTARGWLEIGTTPFDAPDLPEALSYLRRSALGLAPHGVTSKLVLPEDQILYLEVEAPGPSDSVREGQIRRALEGRTPYDVADLVFDWSGEGRKVQVAVIARETLAEAEAFAAEHRFNPISFAAHPDPARFGGEPWFGQTALAASLLPPGEVVERDQEALRVMSRQARSEAAAAVLAATTATPEPVVREPAVSEPLIPETLAPELVTSEPTLPEPVLVEPHPVVAFEPEREPDPVPSSVSFAADPPPAWQPEPAAAVEMVPEPALTPESALMPEAASDPEPEATPEQQIEPELPPLRSQKPSADPVAARPQQSTFDLSGDLFGSAPDLPKGPEVIPPVTTPPRRTKAWTPPAEPGPELDISPPLAAPRRRARQTQEPVIAPASPAPQVPAQQKGVTPQPSAPEQANLPEELPADLISRALASEIPPMPEAPFIALDDDYELDEAAREFSEPKLSITSVTPHRRVPAAPLLPPSTAPSAPEPRAYAPEPEELLAQLDAMEDLPPPSLAPPVAARASGAAPLGAAPLRAPKAPPAPVGASPAKARAKPAKGTLASLVTAPKAKTKPATATLVAPPPAEAQATAASALRGRPEIRPGKPRYLGLVLTALLLLALAVIGAWSSIALSRFLSPSETPFEAPVDVAAAPAVDGTDAETMAADAATDPEAALAGSSSDLEADLPSLDEEAAADGEVVATTESVSDMPLSASEAALAAALALEPAPAAPAAQTAPVPVKLVGEQDEIILSSNDIPPQATDSLTLPPAQVSIDALPAPAVPPPPFGTQYEFGANGLILPTPEGIVTPDGLRLVAGAPPKVPPPRPAAIAALAASTSNAPAALVEPATPETAAETGPTVDPRLQGFRPRPRPEGLRGPAADGAAEIPAEQRMTSLRPRARPADLAEAAAERVALQSRQAAQDEAARAVAAAASLSATATAAQTGDGAVPQGEDAAVATLASTAAIAPRAGPISPQAVAISRKPPQKPRDFDRRVQSAVAAAAAIPRPKPEAEAEEPERSARSAEPGEDEEPVAAAAPAPRVPTKASVAQNATFVNAINLGKTNLIGVYGTPSKRYALIRLGSGQYKKVRVGDRVDGGTVAAITESEVRYKKGGRMVALAMPRG